MARIPTLDDVPYYLMPVAAALAYVFLLSTIRLLYLNFFQTGEGSDLSGGDGSGTPRSTSKAGSKKKKGSGKTGTAALIPTDTSFYVVVSFLVLLCYAYVIGRIEGLYAKAHHASFDPYSILDITQDAAANTTVLQAQYKAKVQYYHPTNQETGNGDELRKVLLAYQALTEEVQKFNYQRHGHPDGPLLTPMFQFSTPKWLYKPSNFHTRCKGSMIAVYTLMTAFVICTYLKLQQEEKERLKRQAEYDAENAMDDDDFTFESNAVRDIDLQHIAKYITPNLTHYEVLLVCLSCPTNVMWATRDLMKIEKLKRERLEEEQEAAASSGTSSKKQASLMDFDSILDDDGWADDNDGGKGDGEDESGEAAAQKAAAKKAEEEKKKRMEQLNRATGKATQYFEDLDAEKGVLGQKWVERTLQNAEGGPFWPPKDLSFFTEKTKMTFEYKGGRVSDPLNHPALRRMLCMLSGRLNSSMLNSHPELLDAGSKKLIDQTYFQSSLTFRHRIGLLLEAMLRVTAQLHCASLMSTTIEAATTFKVGCHYDDKTKEWFHGVVTKQYGCIPSLKLHESSLKTDGETDIITFDEATLEFEVERTHAENFLRQKLALCQKQGIPPQIGLQTYREGWWLIVTCERKAPADGKEAAMTEPLDAKDFEDIKMDPKRVEIFEKEKLSNKLLAAFPMILQNISQKNLKASVKVDIPTLPGTYDFHVMLKSHDFLDCDLQFDVAGITVLDKDSVTRPPKKMPRKPKEGEGEGEGEPAKDDSATAAEPKKTK